MKKTLNFFAFGAAFIALAMLSSCSSGSSSDDKTPTNWVMDITGSYQSYKNWSSDLGWVKNAKLAVVSTDNKTCYITLTPQSEGVSSAHFLGALSNDDAKKFSNGTTVNLYYPSTAYTDNGVVYDYTGQDGSELTMMTKYNYCSAQVSTHVNSSSATISAYASSFAKKQAITCLTFTDKDLHSIQVKTLKISESHNRLIQKDPVGGTPTYGDLTITPSTSGKYQYLYVAIREAESSDANSSYTFVVTDVDGVKWTATMSSSYKVGEYTPASFPIQLTKMN